ncbi:MAG: hypothetical protein GY721_02375 [Deltaproteobacteria bacterium]|nr:hypothetical protein [Deltaproteobacteria bacterium]
MYQRGGEISRRYRVEIDDTTGIVDTFRWSIDDETTWVATGVPITGISHSLNSGVTVTFGATTGHIVGDAWQIDAGMLQATSVAIKGSSTIVSYSMIGAPFLGALRVYRTFFGFPFLRSQALFRDMDVNAVTVSGNKVYAVGAREPAVPPHAATLEVLQLSGSRLLLGGGGQATLTSYAATSVMHDPDWSTIYTTSGNGGGLTALDDTTLLQSSFDPLSDARWVDSELDTLVVVRGGNADGVNGSIDVFSTAVGGVPTFVNSFGFTGADIVESKSTAEIVGGKAFISAGSGGAQVLSTFTGVLLDSVPNPTVTGLLPAEVVANAVTIDNDLMFISNGEAGVYVAQADEDFDRSGPDGPVSLTLLGKLQFGVDQSVNHVAFKNNYLYIASGLGGLKIVRVTSP